MGGAPTRPWPIRERHLAEIRWLHGEVKETREGRPVAGRGALQQAIDQIDRREVIVKLGYSPARPPTRSDGKELRGQRSLAWPVAGRKRARFP